MNDEIEDRRLALRRPAVVPLRYVVVPLAAQYTGYSKKAIYRKIEEHVWREAREYRRAPDGHIFIDLPGVQRWITGQ